MCSAVAVARTAPTAAAGPPADATGSPVATDMDMIIAVKASESFAAVRTPGRLLIRPEFVFREDAAAMPGDPSDRRLPAPAERPPATRLPSPQGSR